MRGARVAIDNLTTADAAGALVRIDDMIAGT